MLEPITKARNNSIPAQTILYKGLNRTPVTGNDEWSSTTNLSTVDWPATTCRASRATSFTLSSGTALFSTLQLAWVDGTSFKYNNVTKGTVTAGVKSMVDFNNSIIIAPDLKYYNYVTDTFGNLGTGTYPAVGSCPDMDYLCVYNNRVFGCKGSAVYGCVINNFLDWISDLGLANGAFAGTVYSLGNFTGMRTYQSHVVIFKGNLFYQMYGSNPLNYKIKEVAEVGLVNNKSLVEANSKMYGVSSAGVFEYIGGIPRIKSSDLAETIYSDAIAGTDGRRYFCSLYNGTSWKLYVYDSLKEIWLQEDTLQVKEFTYLGGYVYALANDNKIYKFNSGSEVVSWEAITGDLIENTFKKKYLTKINIRLQLEASSTVYVYTSIDNASYILQKTITTTGLSPFTATITLTRADHVKIKITGTGKAKIYSMERVYAIGSDW
jgi:hypothetical protein